MDNLEKLACTPVPISADGFNPGAKIPYGVTIEHIRRAMEEFLEFLSFINGQLHSK